ncbi:copper resistance protein CopC [Robertmurraya sp. GLU-23]
MSFFIKEIGKVSLLFIFIFSIFPESFAQAHSSLVKTLPEGEEVLKESPQTIEVWFLDPVVLHSNTITLMGSSGNRVAFENAYIDPKDPTHIIGNVPDTLPADRYTANINVIALDGDILTETFSFKVLREEPKKPESLKLVKHSPVDGQILNGKPNKIDLWFTHSAELTAIGVFDRTQQSIKLKEPYKDPEDPAHIIVEFDEPLEDGTYQVTWYASSSEEELSNQLEIVDVFYFAVNEFTSIEDGSIGTMIQTSWFPDLDLKQFGYWFIFLGLSILFGSNFFIHLVSKEVKEYKRWKRISLGLIFMTTMGASFLIRQQRIEMADLPLLEFFSLQYIWIPVVQIVLLLLGFMVKKLEFLAFGIALLMGPFVMGHASYPRYGGFLTIMVNILHLVAASIWLGGLFALLTMAKRNEFGELLKKVGTSFSKWAFWSLLVIILTGFIMTIQYVPSFSFESFIKSQWGKAVIIKIGLTLLIVFIGFLQRNTLQKLAAALVNKFYRRGIIEILYGVFLLLFASILVVSTPSAAERGIYPLKSSYEQELKVDISPLKEGLNVLTLDFKKEIDMENVKINISMPPENDIEYDAFKIKEGTFKITGNILHGAGSLLMKVEAKEPNGDIRKYEYTIVVPGERMVKE